LKGYSQFEISSLDPRHAKIQALIGLGDRRMGKVIEYVARYGDGLGSWRRALKKCGYTYDSLMGNKSLENHFPWDKIDVGISKKYLIKESRWNR
jgi:hypothetical protein